MAKKYVDGYVLPLSKRKLPAYKKLAEKAGAIWVKHGALQYVECVGEDLKSASKWGCLPFPTMAKAKRSETVVFSFIVYKSKAQRDRVNAKVLKEMSDLMSESMPFDLERMAAGGFETIVVK